jgi:hypothetical protein
MENCIHIQKIEFFENAKKKQEKKTTFLKAKERERDLMKERERDTLAHAYTLVERVRLIYFFVVLIRNNGGKQNEEEREREFFKSTLNTPILLLFVFLLLLLFIIINFIINNAHFVLSHAPNDSYVQKQNESEKRKSILNFFHLIWEMSYTT